MLSEYLIDAEGQFLLRDCLDIKRILIASINTTKANMKGSYPITGRMVMNMNDSWKYGAATGDAHIPYLHDCIATKITVDGSEISLDFPDGFWLLRDDPRNPWDEIHKTGPAQVVVSLGYLKPESDADRAVSAELLRTHRLFPGLRFTSCSKPCAAKLAEKINSGKWTLEFVTKYQAFEGHYLIECCVRTRRSFHKCYLSVDCRQIRFYWNEVLEDRVW